MDNSLTKEQLQHLSRAVRDRLQWLCSRERGFITSDEEITILLAVKLAHALEKVAAAELMAKALEAVLNASITKRDQAEDDAVEALATYKAVCDA